MSSVLKKLQTVDPPINVKALTGPSVNTCGIEGLDFWKGDTENLIYRRQSRHWNSLSQSDVIYLSNSAFCQVFGISAK